jgi:predicted esterase YcpF (UPF0227 family)
MKIFYVHGIGSSGGGNTVEMIKKYFKNDIVISPDIPVDPIEAYEFIKKSVRDCDIVIGTSLGGFYTMMIPGVYKILINPAINADETVKDVIGIGEHEFLRERESGEKTYTIDAEYIKKLSELKKEFFDKYFDYEYKSETYGIFGTKDEVTDERETFTKKWRKYRFYEDDFGHRMTEEVFIRTVAPIIEEIKNEIDWCDSYFRRKHK